MKKLFIVLLAVAAITATYVACTSDSPTTPTTVSQPSGSSVVSAPAPAPTATPAVVGPAAPVFSVNFYPNAEFELFYNGEASAAAVSAYITSFDDQVKPLPVPGDDDGIIEATVQSGKSWTYNFNRQCVQLDIDQPGQKLIDAAFYDKDGKRFSPNTPEGKLKTEACRTVPCVERWVEQEPVYGEWETVPSEDTQTLKCYRHEQLKVTINEKNSCTSVVRVKSTTYEKRDVEIQCPCVNVPTTRTVTTYGNWSNLVGLCGSRTKTVTTYTLNSCTKQETSEVATTTDTKSCGACYYRVSCGNQQNGFGEVEAAGGDHCSDHDQQSICEHTKGGFPLANGVWRNFGPQSLQNHCQYVVPGLSNNDFQLNPGQSDPLCFSKHN